MRRAQYKIIAKNETMRYETKQKSLSLVPFRFRKHWAAHTDRQKTFPTEMDLWSNRNNCSFVHKIARAAIFLILFYWSSWLACHRKLILNLNLSVILPKSFIIIIDDDDRYHISGHCVAFCLMFCLPWCILCIIKFYRILRTNLCHAYFIVVTANKMLIQTIEEKKFNQQCFLLNLHFVEFNKKNKIQWMEKLFVCNIHFFSSF